MSNMTHNGKRLGDVAVFENRQTEPKPNRITNAEDKYKSSIVKVQPGLKPNSEQKAYIRHPAILPSLHVT